MPERIGTDMIELVISTYVVKNLNSVEFGDKIERYEINLTQNEIMGRN